MVVLGVLATVTACGARPTPTAVPQPQPTATSSPTATATTRPTATPAALAPTMTITSPADGSSVPAGDVKVTVQVSNFNLVGKLGQASAQGEGHIHYFIDATAPTTPGQAAVTAPGTYAPSTATAYTWPGVAPGAHTFSAELVNNDHTPLAPSVVAKVTVTVTTGGTPQAVTINLAAQNLSFDKKKVTVSAGASVTLVLDNRDGGTVHNVSIYDPSVNFAPVFVGPTVTGPGTITYRFTAPARAGTYTFMCDIHPSLMYGDFEVVP